MIDILAVSDSFPDNSVIFFIFLIIPLHSNYFERHNMY